MTQQLRTFDGGLVTFNTEKLEKLIQTHSNIFLLDFILCSFNFLFIQPYLNQLLCVPLLPPCRHVQSVQWYEQLRGFSLINTIVTSAATFLPTSTSTNPCTRPPSCFCNTTLILNKFKGWKVELKMKVKQRLAWGFTAAVPYDNCIIVPLLTEGSMSV